WAQAPPPAVESRAQIEKHIRDKFVGKLVTLRNFYTGKKLEYNEQGEAVNGRSGIWTADGVVQVRKVNLEEGRLEIEGKRLGVFFKEPAVKPYFLNINQNVKIALAVPLSSSSSDLKDILSKVFILEMEELWTYLPEYVRLRIEKPSKSQKMVQNDGFPPIGLVLVPKPVSAEQKSVAPMERTVPPDQMRLKQRDGTFITASKDRLKAPKAIIVPEPEYSLAGRAAHVQGVVVISMVVTEQGRPEELSVTRPLGGGLDEQALLTLQQWRFKPATLDGNPISVKINIEINFNLY
ncbi:MAG: energy transducer TonB, partial [Terriglobia bacterium]